jgi:hypothetical protein
VPLPPLMMGLLLAIKALYVVANEVVKKIFFASIAIEIAPFIKNRVISNGSWVQGLTKQLLDMMSNGKEDSKILPALQL